MEINGPERQDMANNLTTEAFFIQVATDIEHQLKEWDRDYEVIVMKLKNYEFVVKNKEQYFELSFSENLINTLQRKDPFELDREIWKGLEDKGLPIVKGNGSYIDIIMW